MQRELKVSDHADFAKRTLDEHHHLAETRTRLRHLLEQCINHPGQDQKGQLRSLFKDFNDHLLRHMDFEEEGGYMAPLLEVRPTVSSKVEQLQADHDHLRSELEEVMKEIESTGEFCQPVMDMILRLANLLDFVETHERAENGLVMETFFQDTGDKD